MSAYIEVKYINPNSLIHMCTQTTFFPKEVKTSYPE